MKITQSSLFSLLLAAVLAPVQAQTPDSTSLELGAGKNAQLLRAGAQWNWDRQWLNNGSAYLGGYWDLTAARHRQQRYQNRPGANHGITDIGITPVFRYQGLGRTGAYAEAGIGVHYFSSLFDNAGHQLATRFQFGDHLAAGYCFVGGWDVSVKLQHFSNGGIKHPNGGANYLILRVAKDL
jgi:hypothetical protein